MAPIRAHINADGRIEYRRRTAHYYQRFQGVQSFLERFYGASCGPADRDFLLTSSDVNRHWSAHIFHKEKVAFFGFNTCFLNDEFWRGATLEDAAVTSATAHGRVHAKDYLWVAIWHHGLATDRGNPDHLIVRDVGRLRASGFHVGMHGHTHLDEFGDMRDVLGERFPIVATGSFAAGPLERPEGALNQFSVIELSPTYVCIERYARQRSTRWMRNVLTPYALRAPISPETFNDARVHERIFTVDLSTGLTDVQVRFEGLSVRSALVLAQPSGPFSNMLYSDAATDAGTEDVIERTGERGESQLVLHRTGNFERLRWSCRMSNILARDQADLAMTSHPKPDGRIPGEYDWIAHDLTLHSRQLVLSIRTAAPGQVLFSPSECRLFIFDTAGMLVDLGRVDYNVASSDETLTVTVGRPVVGYRYVLAYKPVTEGRLCPSETLSLIGNVCERLRSGRLIDPVRTRMAGEITTGLKLLLRSERVTNDDEITWYGYLWNDRLRQLQTCFGNCPWWSAATTFDFGRGVVGHAFRMGEPASYYATQDVDSLILIGETEFQWIVAIPILLEERGPAVGVIAFAGTSRVTWDVDLQEYAQRLAQQRDIATRITRGPRSNEVDAAAADRLSTFERVLVQGATLLFWNAMRGVADGLGDQDRHECRRIVSYWREQYARASSDDPQQQ